MHGVLWAEKITYPYGGLAQLVRAPASHAGGHWFESSSLHQKIPDFLRNQEFFLFCGSKSFLQFLSFGSDQYTDQYVLFPHIRCIVPLVSAYIDPNYKSYMNYYIVVHLFVQFIFTNH